MPLTRLGRVKSLLGIRERPPEPDRSTNFFEPANGDFRVVHRTKLGLQVLEIFAVLEGDTTPQVDFTVRFGPDASNPVGGTELVTGGMSCTSGTTGQVFATLDASTIPAADKIWIVTTTVTGVVRSFLVTLAFTNS